MLEQTWTLFTDRSDEPCTGADRLAPTDLGADPWCSVNSGSWSTPPHQLEGPVVLPCRLGDYPPDLCHVGGRPLIPVG
jgi:hypothetical protein